MDTGVSADFRARDSIGRGGTPKTGRLGSEADRPERMPVAEHGARVGSVAEWSHVAATTTNLNLPATCPAVEKHGHVGWNPIDIAAGGSRFQTTPAVGRQEAVHSLRVHSA